LSVCIYNAPQQGLKPYLSQQRTGRIKDNAADFDEAFELFDLLGEEVK